MVIKKWLWHMPLYRRQQGLALQGIRISRDRLVAWMIKFVAILEPAPKTSYRRVCPPPTFAAA